MSLPQGDPSLPSLVSPIFSDIDAARGDHLRANNNVIWQNFTYLENKPVIVQRTTYINSAHNFIDVLGSISSTNGPGSYRTSFLVSATTGLPADLNTGIANIEFTSFANSLSDFELFMTNNLDNRTWQGLISGGSLVGWKLLTDATGAGIANKQQIILSSGNYQYAIGAWIVAYGAGSYKFSFDPATVTSPSLPYAGASGYCIMDVECYNGLATLYNIYATRHTTREIWTARCVSGAWDAWTQLTDATGQAMVAAACSGNAATATLAATATNALGCSGNAATATTCTGSSAKLGGQLPLYYTDIPTRQGFHSVERGTGVSQSTSDTIQLGLDTDYNSRLRMSANGVDYHDVVLDKDLYKNLFSKNVPSDRDFGITYYNNTSKPMIVQVTVGNSSDVILIDGYVAGIVVQSRSGAGISIGVILFVPVGASYKVNQTGYVTYQWMETTHA